MLDGLIRIEDDLWISGCTRTMNPGPDRTITYRRDNEFRTCCVILDKDPSAGPFEQNEYQESNHVDIRDVLRIHRTELRTLERRISDILFILAVIFAAANIFHYRNVFTIIILTISLSFMTTKKIAMMIYKSSFATDCIYYCREFEILYRDNKFIIRPYGNIPLYKYGKYMYYRDNEYIHLI